MQNRDEKADQLREIINQYSKNPEYVNMNTYIYAGNSALLVVKDNDLNSVSSVRNHYLNIDWAWVIEEDGVLKFNGKEYDVKAGDIVLVLYASYKRSDDDREIAIIKSEELYNNFKRNLEYEKNRHNECCDKCSPSTC